MKRARRNDPTASQEPGRQSWSKLVRMELDSGSARRQPNGTLRKVTFVDNVCKKV